MKKNIPFILVAMIVVACGQKNNHGKQEELLSLKKQHAEITEKIARLEAELGTSNDEKKMSEVGVQAVQSSVFRSYIEIQGKVDAEQNVNVSPEAQGIIKSLYIQVGQHVQQGQVLAQIDDLILKQNIAELQTQIDLTNQLFQKQKNLWEQKIGTEVQFLNVKAQKEALERKMATLKSQSSLYQIKAPIAGVVDVMDLKVGQAVAPGSPGIKIVNQNHLKVKALVPDSYVAKIRVGNAVIVEFPDLHTQLNAQLNFMANAIDPVTRSFGVEIKLPTNSNYRPNMLAVLKVLDYQNNKAITLPISCIQKSESGDFVYLAVGKVAQKAVVKIGRTYAGKAEVIHGLKVGDKVIVVGATDVNDGDLLKY